MKTLAKEQHGTIDGITYAAEQTVTIKVKDDNGRLVADEGSDLIQTAELENTYDASGSIGLKGTKKFKYGIFGDEDSNDPRKKNFTFSVYQKTKDCDAVTRVESSAIT